MKIQLAIDSIKTALEENIHWLDEGHLLINSQTSELLRDPHTECSFGAWLYSEGQIFSEFDWFKTILAEHQKTHETFEVLRDEALRMYNPKTNNELRDYYTALEEQSVIYVDALDVAEKAFYEISDEKYDELVLKHEKKISEPEVANQEKAVKEKKEEVLIETTITPKSNKDETEDNDTSNSLVDSGINNNLASMLDVKLPTEQNEFHQKLKQQDLEQIELEKNLTEKEINQLVERQKLTQQSVEQLKQYQLLKEQESASQEKKNSELEALKREEKSKKQQEINDIKEQTQSKQKELEQMGLISLKFDKKKLEEQKKEEESLTLLDQQQAVVKADIEKLDQQQELREKELAKLKQQVLLIEEELDQFAKDKLTKLQDIKDIEDKKALNKKELESESNKLLQLNQQKLEVEKLKQEEIKSLEEQQQQKLNELRQLDEDLQKLKEDMLAFSKSNEQEILALEKQQKLKQESLNKLESEQKSKEQALEQLAKQQQSTHGELMQLKQRSDEPQEKVAEAKELEKA